MESRRSPWRLDRSGGARTVTHKPEAKISSPSMNLAHLHLMLTHVPILGSLFSLWLLLLTLSPRNQHLQRTALWTLFLTGLCAAAAYLTGDPARTFLMKAAPSISADLNDQHAEVAVLALALSSVAGAVGLGGLWMYPKERRFTRTFGVASIGLTLVSSIFLAWTANLGGNIRHSELRQSQPNNHPTRPVPYSRAN